MRRIFSLAAVMLLATHGAHALEVDPKGLARYDHSYVQCEAQLPEMRGHRDAAYLKLWRIKLDKTTQAQLTATRKGAVYQAEKRSLKQPSAAKPAASAAETLALQCKGLWAEYKREGQAAPKTHDEHKH